MNDQKKEFWDFMEILNESGIAKHVVLIGSWAEYIYEKSELLPADYMSMMKTRDLDFLVRNLYSFPSDVNLPLTLHNKDYSVVRDYFSDITKFITPKGTLEIEFLVSAKGAGTVEHYKVGNGIVSEGLRHMEILSSNIVEINSSQGISFYVPIPEAYVIHKMVINHERRPDKIEKDKNAILQIFPRLDIDRLNYVCEGLSKAERKYLRDFCDENKIDVDYGKDHIECCPAN